MKLSSVRLLFLVLVGSGCGWANPDVLPPKVKPAFDSSKTHAVPEDYRVLSAAINHFSTLKEAVLRENHKGVNSVVLLGKTVGKSGMIDAEQMAPELGMKYKVLPQQLSVNLQARNTKATSLMGMKGYSRRVEVRKSYPSGRSFLAKEQPKKVWVESWLPGYSKDGQQAIVRFWFGPSPHGATGNYLMEKRNRQWRVKWHNLAFYV